jgi:hypothetical protein
MVFFMQHTIILINIIGIIAAVNLVFIAVQY